MVTSQCPNLPVSNTLPPVLQTSQFSTCRVENGIIPFYILDSGVPNLRMLSKFVQKASSMKLLNIKDGHTYY